MSDFNPGQHIGDYEVISILGAGGMGKVYKVRNLISDRTEALKVLLPDLTSQQSLADRFLREIRLLATLCHPNIAALRTALTFENQLVMVMEFVEGETIANRIARAPISTADAVNYSDQALSALSYAHQQNIIHRDIKPANIMLTPQGVVKLMDFGIARSSKDGSLTSTGTTLGSLNYMPPEQVRGEAADARSDIYSFGVSLYEMLTGKLPFRGDSQYSMMTAHLNENPPEPITLRADIPDGLNQIIMMAMAKDPANRFQTADAFRNALKSVPVSSLPSSNTTMTPTPGHSSETTLIGTPLPGRTPTIPATPPSAARLTPAPAPPTAPPTVTQPPIPVPPQPASSRGLWLALGAILGIAVLVVAGIYVPRYMRTNADPRADKSKSNSSQQQTDPSPATPVNPAPSDSATPAPADTSAKPSTTPGPIQPAPAPTKSHAAIAKTQDNAPAPTPGPPQPSPEELARLADEGDKLNVRASSVSQSLDTLRHQQMAAGYNLRADMASAQERMKMYISKGDAALKSNDTTNAQKYYDLAEQEISKVEKFLGH
jgi:eukaryotic-like serine/threonine-protein kinase